MDSIMATARRHGLKVVEDAAQGIMASYNNTAFGAIGDLGGFSFHETKNIISGEGGSLLVNDRGLALRAEILREKGTDRGRFFAARSTNIPDRISVVVPAERNHRRLSLGPVRGGRTHHPRAVHDLAALSRHAGRAGR
jgi:dTDP-4-amino-4,6-dideoxygalactose transaminase